MNDDAEKKLNALFAAARADERDTSRAEFGFETRLAARLREEGGGSLAAWAWKLCPFFAALALAATWWGHVNLRTEATAEVVAEATQDNAEQVLLAYMTGERP
jgi:hypothetical protein